MEKFTLITKENRREIREYADIVMLDNDIGNAARKVTLNGIKTAFALFGSVENSSEENGFLFGGLYIGFFGGSESEEIEKKYEESGLFSDTTIRTVEEAEKAVNEFIEKWNRENP